jgi:hypothetical protein
VAAALISISGLATQAKAAGSSASVTLEWTAPGDDSLVGRAAQYDIRYHVLPLSEANFSVIGNRVTNVPAPSPAGTTERFTVTGLNPGTSYYFAIKTADEKGNWSRISNVVVRAGQGPVAAEDGERVVSFSAPYPNPCRTSARFAITVPEESDVRVEAFDVSGRLLRTLASGTQAAGDGTLVWDLRDSSGRTLGAGLYFVRARIGSSSFTRRVMVSH